MKNKKWWIPFLKGILLIILGIIAVRRPEGALVTLGLYIGCLSLFTGIMYIFNSLSHREYDRSGWFLVEGLIDMLFGVILVSNPGITLELLPFMLGFWIIFIGVTQISAGYALKKVIKKNRWMLYALGVLAIISGMLLINASVLVSLAITTFLGIYFITYGIFMVFSSMRLKDKDIAL